MDLSRYKNILNEFKNTESFTIVTLLGIRQLSPDTVLYTLGTTCNLRYIFETDFIFDFEYEVLETVEKEIGKIEQIYEVKNPIENYKDAKPYTFTDGKCIPSDWDNIKKYANDKFSSKPYYFNFLFK